MEWNLVMVFQMSHLKECFESFLVCIKSLSEISNPINLGLHQELVFKMDRINSFVAGD